MRRAFGVLAVSLAAWLLPQSACAQKDDPKPDVKKLENEVERLRDQLRAAEDRLKNIKSEPRKDDKKEPKKDEPKKDEPKKDDKKSGPPDRGSLFREMMKKRMEGGPHRFGGGPPWDKGKDEAKSSPRSPGFDPRMAMFMHMLREYMEQQQRGHHGWHGRGHHSDHHGWHGRGHSYHRGHGWHGRSSQHHRGSSWGRHPHHGHHRHGHGHHGHPGHYGPSGWWRWFDHAFGSQDRGPSGPHPQSRGGDERRGGPPSGFRDHPPSGGGDMRGDRFRGGPPADFWRRIGDQRGGKPDEKKSTDDAKATDLEKRLDHLMKDLEEIRKEIRKK